MKPFTTKLLRATVCFGFAAAIDVLVVWLWTDGAWLNLPGKWPAIVAGGASVFFLILWVALYRTKRRQPTGDSPRRIARRIALIPVAAALALVVVLLLWTTVPASFVSVLFAGADAPFAAGNIFWLALAPLWAAAAWGFWCRLVRWQSVPRLSALALLATGGLIYLGWDDASVALQTPVDLLTPPLARGAESDALYRSLIYPMPGLPDWQRGHNFMADDGEWRLFVVANPDAIQNDWAVSRESRRILERLDAFDLIGDVWQNGDSDPNPAGQWQSLRELSWIYTNYAALLAIEGKGDEAVLAMRPLLSLSRKFQPATRTVLRLIVIRVLQSMGQQTVRMILHTSPLKPETLRELEPLLQPVAPPGATEARVLATELQVFALPAFHNEKAGERRLGLLRRFLYLPNATANALFANNRSLLGILAEGRGEDLRSFRYPPFPTSFKNAVGALYAVSATPALGKILQHGWKTDDARRALLAQVQVKLAEAGVPGSAPLKGSP